MAAETSQTSPFLHIADSECSLLTYQLGQAPEAGLPLQCSREVAGIGAQMTARLLAPQSWLEPASLPEKQTAGL